MAKDTSNAFWGTQEEGQANGEDGHKTGIQRVQAESIDTLLAHALAEHDPNLDTSAYSARQAFGLLKASAGDIVLPTPYKCSVNAPDEINVFTDGSWIFPRKQFLGIGGAGVWWPKRTLTNQSENTDLRWVPISDAEFEIAHAKQEDNGVSLYAKIGGYSGSSTRTEIAAGIIATCAHGPVHIGSDSKVFVDRANKLIEDIRLSRKPHLIFKIAKDGDMWEQFL
jgi:hypothetical protein